jgi:hypothetical protein
MSEARQRALARMRREQPQAYRDLVMLVQEAERRDERRRCEDSFLEFVKRAWREIDPAPLSLAWFHEVIIEHLEAICFGELRTLIINCPPRTGKSALCSILYPAWVWCRSDTGPQSGPGVKFFCVSYGAILAEEIAVKMRRLVMGSWYQGHWGNRVKLLPDQSSRANFGNTAGGERISNSIEGGLLGRGGSCQICFPFTEFVHTEKGPRRIGEIVDRHHKISAWSFNPAARRFELRPIIGWHRNPGRPLVRITTNRGSIEPTLDHLVYTDKGLVEAGDLEPGDLLVAAPGGTLPGAEPVLSTILETTRLHDVPRWTYCITVEYNHNLLVGEDARVVVSNCDDPHSIAGAESDLERRATLRAFSEGLPTRITNPQTSARILVCQRTHEDDVTNLALETWTDAVHIMLPARFEPDRCCAQDRRTYAGELLWPEIWDEKSLTAVEAGLQGLEKGQAGLSSYAVSAQLQQAPIPRGGGIIERTAWHVWPETTPQAGDLQPDPRNPGEFLVALPPVSYVLISVDTAFSEADTADFNGIVCLGVWHRRRELMSRPTAWFGGRWATGGGQPLDPAALREEVEENAPLDQPRVILMEAQNFRAKLNDMTLGRGGKPIGLVQRLLDMARRRRADRILIENANRGQDTIREIARQMNAEEFQLEMHNPREHGDKVSRMWSVQPLFSQGLVSAPAHLVPGVDHFGNPCVEVREFRWVEEVVSQCQRTPQGKQDLADAMSAGLIWLRRNNFLELTAEHVKNELAARAWKPPGLNIVKHYLGD